ncbi:MAG: AAA family ATPase [Opitutaceae bacterium]|nr:AAA family ATPase [Cytophagales bacterium]
MKTNEVNPFPVTTYISHNYFCNRELELKTLFKNNQNGLHTCLFAQRRVGKTGLIKHFFNEISTDKSTKCLYVDIFSTQNQAEFVRTLSNEIFQTFPPEKSIGRKFMEAIKSFRPVLSYDSLSGTPELSLDIADNKTKEKSIQEIFRFLDNQQTKLIIAIDEFQQITEYPEKNTEALLRSIMQQMQHITFVFCGSNLRLMNEMFHNTKRPFYSSCQSMYLGKISETDYSSFIKRHFEHAKRSITDESIAFILNWTCRHTYYTQYLCNQAFAGGNKKIELTYIQQVCKAILEQEQMVFFQYKKLLTADQWTLLIAVAKEEKITQPYANSFISKYRLKSSANVKRSLESLLEKEMLYSETTATETFYEVYDKYLMRWMELYA